MDNGKRAGGVSGILALAFLGLGVVYTGLIIWAVLTQDPVSGKIRDNILFLMEAATIVSSFVILFFIISVHRSGEILNKNPSFVSVILMSMCTVITTCVHFTVMSVGGTAAKEVPGAAYYLSLAWPSVPLALDILAWDLLFGLAFVFLGAGFMGKSKATGATMIAAGIMSIAGLIALPLGNMNVRFIGIIGYSVVPVISMGLYLAGAKKGG